MELDAPTRDRASMSPEEIAALAREEECASLSDASSAKRTCLLARSQREGASVERARAKTKLQKLEPVVGGSWCCDCGNYAPNSGDQFYSW